MLLLSTAQLELVAGNDAYSRLHFQPRTWLRNFVVAGEATWMLHVATDVLTIVTRQFTRLFAPLSYVVCWVALFVLELYNPILPILMESIEFRGPPDPLRGDEYYRRVRECAKECLDAIFDTNVTAVAGISTRIKGVGNPEAAPQSSGWFNKAPKDTAPTPSQGPNVYGTQQPTGYDAPGYPGGYNGPPYPSNDPNQYPQQQPPYPGGPLPPYGSNAGPGGNYPAPGMTGLGNPMFEEKKGFFGGLKEKVSFKSEPKVTFAGAPPGSQNAPDGWNFSTNRGPTSGAYNPNAPSTYNPSEPYRPNQQQQPPYNASNVGGYTGPTSSYAAPSGLYSDTDAEVRQNKSQELRDRAYEGERKKGRVGGVWDNMPTPTLPQASSQPRPSSRQDDGPRPAERIHNEWAQEQQYVRRHSAGPPHAASQQHDQQQHVSGPYGRGGASSDGAYERGIIEGLCAPGGMRAVPPKDKLDLFLKSALTLDAEVVGPILDELVGATDASWQVVSKALTVIDGLLATNGCETFHEYFSDNYDMILQVSTTSEKAAVRDRAVKILHVLGKSVPSSSQAAPAPRRSSAATQPSNADLLGGFDSPKAASAPATAQLSTTAPQAPGGLFAGLQTSSSSLDVHSAPPSQPAPPVQSATSMFGGLSLGGTDSTPAAGSTFATTAPTTSVSFDPLLQPAPVPPQPTYAPAYNPNQFMAPQQPYYGVQPPPMMPLPPSYAPHHQQHVPFVQAPPPPPMGLHPQYQHQYVLQQQQYLAKPVASSSQVIGAAMIPTGYIAKTIHEPTDSSTFNFMKRDDSFNFVKDHMKG
ncbi:hypothetical protein DYB32_008767 [Aphanomyces invadans]|uniref:ENTH domain-containing protein n=1 Tax=Aphanomyces invadans TaxID=157072 RepID=A0A418AU42_9STRA|nr:hypothetical protein DYB32_008767 [Aphanomyces invadans]